MTIKKEKEQPFPEKLPTYPRPIYPFIRVSSKGQIVIPKKFREMCDIEIGDLLYVYVKDKIITLSRIDMDTYEKMLKTFVRGKK